MMGFNNVPAWERALRVVAGAVVALFGVLWVAGPLAWAVALGGFGFAMTGVVGFCPACAIVGRRPVARESR